MIGVFLEAVSAFGADQVAVQRYLSADSERTSQRAFVLNMLGIFIVVPSLLLTGMGLYAHFQQHPDEITFLNRGEFEPPADARRLAKAQEPGTRDRALPAFVRGHFPAGMTGLFLVALMAAVMSSIDSGIHSVTTALVVDFRDRLFPQLKPEEPERDVVLIRSLVFLTGALAVFLACHVGDLGDVFTIGKKTTSAFGGPLLAVFILALFSPRSRTMPVFLGTLISAAATFALMFVYPKWFSVWFWPIGFGLAMVLSVGLNLILPGQPHAEPLTFAVLRNRNPES